MEHVNDIINNLCEKLGTTAEYIAPEYAKMQIASSTSQLIVVIVLVAIYLAVLIPFLRYYVTYDTSKSSSNMDDVMRCAGYVMTCLGIVDAVFLVLTCVMEIPMIAKFTASPEGAFFEYVVNQIK